MCVCVCVCVWLTQLTGKDGIDNQPYPVKIGSIHTWNISDPVGWDRRIFRLHLNKCPEYDTKQSDGEGPVILELGECG